MADLLIAKGADVCTRDIVRDDGRVERTAQNKQQFQNVQTISMS